MSCMKYQYILTGKNVVQTNGDTWKNFLTQLEILTLFYDIKELLLIFRCDMVLWLCF